MGRYLIDIPDDAVDVMNGSSNKTLPITVNIGETKFYISTGYKVMPLKESELEKEAYARGALEAQKQYSESGAKKYQEGYEAGFKEGRKRTELSEEKDRESVIQEVWDCAARIFSPDAPRTLSGQEIIDVFGCDYNSAHALNPADAVKKLKEYDQLGKQEYRFRVGEEIKIKSGEAKAVITYVDPYTDGIEFIYDSGQVGKCSSEAHDYWEKTGRYYDK